MDMAGMAKEEERAAKMENIMDDLTKLWGIVDAIRITLGIETTEEPKSADRNPINPAIANVLERDIRDACQHIRRTTVLLKEVDVATRRLRAAIMGAELVHPHG